MNKLLLFLIATLGLLPVMHANATDYTKGLSVWFDTPNTLQGHAVWYGGKPVKINR